MPKSHGIRRKSRHILRKGNMSKGLSHLLINYSIGDKVVVVIDPSEHKTTPHRRFQGRVGYIKDIGRRTAKVGILVGDKQKTLQTKFNHIRPIK
ncbi:MAG: 50S ribosomal protein L21 [Thaumarchaeota archaeon]|nr:MAG: 50S ribosomal protein L21 [Nitrososphaerota archaeon]TLX91927.1 MAG: 50S ribosomal protein L21 [Nitrososphaerota archaeon]